MLLLLLGLWQAAAAGIDHVSLSPAAFSPAAAAAAAGPLTSPLLLLLLLAVGCIDRSCKRKRQVAAAGELAAAPL